MHRRLRSRVAHAIATPFVVAILALALAIGQPSSVMAQEGAPPAGEGSSLPAAEAENAQQLWFVQLRSRPAADGTSATTLRRERAGFREEAETADIEFKERYAFGKLFNGLSLKVDRSEVEALDQLDAVEAVYPVEEVPLPELSPREEPNLASALAMTGADVAQSELGYDGAGVKVGVIDTGIDFDHPDLGGCFGSGCRVVTGHDFVGEAFTGSNAPVPDANPDDCHGHGTHVGGIVGASGAVKGVAPGVTFGAYKVFGCTGSTTADVMIAAMERALADDMDIVNMSIGASNQWPQYPTAQAADRLVKQGIPVVASIGNSGADGAYSASAPGVADKVIGVAAFDNTHSRLKTFTISPDDTAIGYNAAAGSPAPPTSGTVPLARTGTKTSTTDACSALAPGSLIGKVALVRRGGCPYHQKALNAQNAGAQGVMLYNSVPGRFSVTVAGTPPITVPVVTVSDSEGVAIDDRLASGPVTMTWTDQTGSFSNTTGGRISSFSSFGLSPDLALKPDLGAPGGYIRSTYPREKGDYTTLSGSSMASPHVAGAAALLLDARPSTPAQRVRDILQNSADPKEWRSDPDRGLDNVHRQGAGMLDVDDAIVSKTTVSPAKLSLGESEIAPSTRTLTLKNDSPSEVAYDLSHSPALSTGGSTYAPSITEGPAMVTFGSNSVTVPAGEETTVNVTIAHNPALADKSQYGGYLVLTPRGGGAPQRVPYAGFKGDYQWITTLTPTQHGFPFLGKLNPVDRRIYRQGEGAGYTLAGGDVPYVLFHLEHPVRRMRLEVTDASGQSRGVLDDIEYMARSTGQNGYYQARWDGTTKTGDNEAAPLPNGTYWIKLSVQKALGEEGDPAHWESWTSPSFNLQRPPLPAPSVTSPESGSFDTDGDVTVSGSAGPGETVEVFDAGTSQGKTTASSTGAWSRALTEVDDGSHAYTAIASNASGQVSPPSAAVTVTVDTAAPDTTIDSGPSGPVNVPSASFAFSSPEMGTTFECSLEGEPFARCDPPKDYAGLSDGERTLRVRAVDRAGNEDPTPASRTWNVDTSAPSGTVAIVEGAYAKSTALNLSLLASDPPPGSGVTSMRFSNDGSTWSEWEPYATTKAWTLNGGDGDKTVHVEYRDGAGNVAAKADNAIRLDTVAPNVTISSGPSGLVNSTSARFAFSSEAGAVFECSFDAAPFAPCDSPKSYHALTAGWHTFSVRASDAAGNAGSTASRAWTVDTTRPRVTLVRPTNPARGVARTANATATFSEAMSASTLNKTTFTLVRKGTTAKVPARVTYSAAAKKATLNPTAGLVARATYVATVTTGARDLAGNAPLRSKTWRFTVKK